MKRTRLSIVAAAAIAICYGLAIAPAYADSPHFIGDPSCTISTTTGLTCSGKAAGLGNGPVVAFLTADSVNATYVCHNKGGNVAPGQPIVSQNVEGPSQNITPHNGSITFAPTIPPPPKPSSATDCPNGNWSVVLTALSYTNVVLHIQIGGVDVLTFSFGNIGA
jgi:hypothetical protein